MDPSITSDLAKYVTTLTYQDLPPNVVQKAQACLLDSVGCMVGGTRVDEVRQTIDIILEWGKVPEARVPAIPGTYPAPIAAYASAQLANALDYDDTVSGVGHPGAAIIATVLALGQEQGASGEDLITAIVAGYDTAIRVGRGMKPSEHRAKTVRGHSWAIFGSVAAAASLLNLTADGCRYAFGFAAQHAPVPFVGKWYERPITAIKNNYGWAAMGGIISARLAERGAEGNPSVLDGETGFWAMASSDQWDAAHVTADLGTRFSILDVEFKPFAACRYTHSALDALRSILSEHRIEVSSINSIVVRAAARSQVFADYNPKTLLDAQFSLPYAIASTVLGRPLTSFDSRDSQLAELAASVEIVTDQEAERQANLSGLPATVEVHLRDGHTHAAHTDIPPGTPARALSSEDLNTKFMTLSIPVVGEDLAEGLCRLICGPVEQLSATALAEKFGLS